MDVKSKADREDAVVGCTACAREQRAVEAAQREILGALELAAFGAVWVLGKPADRRERLAEAMKEREQRAVEEAVAAAAHIADNAATIHFAETMSRNEKSDTATRIAAAIRAIERGRG